MASPVDHLFGAGKPAPGVEAAGAGLFTGGSEGEVGEAMTGGNVAVAAARHCATYAFSVVVL